MKKSFLIISTVCTMLFSSNLLAIDSGKFDGTNRETYEEYQERKRFIEENISGKFTGTAGINNGTLTFSQAHIACTQRESLTDNNSFGGDMEAAAYNACMATYAPFLDSSEGVGSCASDTIEWGDFGTGANCYADVADLEDGQSFLFENENTADAYQGFAKIACNSGTLEIIDSKCDLVPDPCLAGDTIGDPDRLPARYKENDNWRNSHLWPVTEPMWARPDSGSYVLPQDPRGIDRSQQFKDKVLNGDREDYCYATISPMNPGSAGATFPMQSGDLVVNPNLDNSDAYFDNDRSNGVWRCFDGEFYNEGSNCQYEVQSCDATVVNVSNGAGQSCQFNLPFQQHNSIFTSRNPTPENSIGSVKAFCWDGNWEIWEESCNLSCNNSFSDNSWLSEDGDPEQCRHSSKNFPSRTAPTSVVTINNENNKMEGNVSYTCNNGTWNVTNEVCKPKECNTLSANTWVVGGAACNHKTLEYVTPHNETIKTSANNPSNENIGVITYQCRYGNFVDITNYSGDPEFAPTITGFSPNDKNCVETSIPQCYYDDTQTQPSGDPSIFIDEGNGCYIECTQNPTTGDQNCTKFCTATPITDPSKNCFFPSGYSSCPAKGWYPEGDGIHCPQWKLNPQICQSGQWVDQIIPEKEWASKTVSAFTEALTHRNYVNQNVTPTVTVNFGRVFNINTGTTSIPNFTLVTDIRGNRDTKDYFNFNGNSSPVLIDSAGTTILYSGSTGGHLFKFGNIDGNLTGTFTKDSLYLNIWEGTNSNLAISDINNDGELDMLVGNYSGGVAFYKGGTSLPSAIKETTVFNDIIMYPNPTKNTITIDVQKNETNNATIELINLLGETLIHQKITTKKTTINLSNYSQGIYLVKFSNQNGNKVYKVIKE